MSAALHHHRHDHHTRREDIQRDIQQQHLDMQSKKNTKKRRSCLILDFMSCLFFFMSILTSSTSSSYSSTSVLSTRTEHPFMSSDSTLSRSGSINSNRLRFLRSFPSSSSLSSHSAVSSSSSGIIIRNLSLFPSLPSSCPANCVCDSTVSLQKRVLCTKGSLKQIPTEKMDSDTKVS